MDFENKIVTVNLVFLDSRSLKWGSKEYVYYMSEELYNKIFDTLYDKEFSIVNAKGYNYRNATLKMVSSSLIKEQNTIKNLKEQLVEIKEVIYDRFKYRTFQRENSDKIYIPEIISGISEVAKTAKTIENSFNNLCSYFNVMDNDAITLNSTLSSISNLPSTSTSTSNLPYYSLGTAVDKEKMEKNEKENSKMNKFGFDFRFGKVPTNEIRMSIYGPAFHANDGYFAFDGNDYVNVTDFLLDINNYCFMLPATEEQVDIGDFIYHNNGWCRVIDAHSRTITVEKTATHEVVEILPTKNMFGFNFYTKLFMPFELTNPNKDNPFGNMLPLLAMSNDNNSDDMLMMMILMNGQNGQNGFNFDTSNPMGMYLMISMLGDRTSGNNDTLMMAMLMGQMNKTPHNCNCSNGDN